MALLETKPTRYLDRCMNSWFTVTNGIKNIHASSSGRRLIGQDHQLGTSNPDWKVKVSLAMDASSAYSATKRFRLEPYVYRFAGKASAWNTIWKKWDTSYHTATFVDLPVSSQLGRKTTDSTVRDQALKAFKNKLEELIENAQLLTPTAELRELNGSVKRSAQYTVKMLESLEHILKGRKRAPAVTLQHLKDLWLTYSFAVAPLIGDTQKAINAVKAWLNKPGEIKRVSGTAKMDWVTSGGFKLGEARGFRFDVKTQATHEIAYTFVGAFDTRFVSANDYSLQRHLGFTEIGAKLPALGWELMPFSWVLDYFGTVGDFLSDTWEAPEGSTIYFNEVRKYTGEEQGFVNWTPSSEYGYSNQELQYAHGESSDYGLISFERKVLNNIPRRAIRLKTVDEIGKSAVNKLLNLASITKFRVR